MDLSEDRRMVSSKTLLWIEYQSKPLRECLCSSMAWIFPNMVVLKEWKCQLKIKDSWIKCQILWIIRRNITTPNCQQKNWQGRFSAPGVAYLFIKVSVIKLPPEEKRSRRRLRLLITLTGLTCERRPPSCMLSVLQISCDRCVVLLRDRRRPPCHQETL